MFTSFLNCSFPRFHSQRMNWLLFSLRSLSPCDYSLYFLVYSLWMRRILPWVISCEPPALLRTSLPLWYPPPLSPSGSISRVTDNVQFSLFSNRKQRNFEKNFLHTFFIRKLLTPLLFFFLKAKILEIVCSSLQHCLYLFTSHFTSIIYNSASSTISLSHLCITSL